VRASWSLPLTGATPQRSRSPAAVCCCFSAGMAGQMIQGKLPKRLVSIRSLPFGKRSNDKLEEISGERGRGGAGEQLRRSTPSASSHCPCVAYRPSQTMVLSASTIAGPCGLSNRGIVGPSGRRSVERSCNCPLGLRPPTEGLYLITVRPAASFASQRLYRRVSTSHRRPRLLHDRRRRHTSLLILSANLPRRRAEGRTRGRAWRGSTEVHRHWHLRLQD